MSAERTVCEKCGSLDIDGPRQFKTPKGVLIKYWICFSCGYTKEEKLYKVQVYVEDLEALECTDFPGDPQDETNTETKVIFPEEKESG